MSLKYIAPASVALALVAGLAACGGQQTRQDSHPQTAVQTSADLSCAEGAWWCERFERGSLTRWEATPAGAGSTIGAANGALTVDQDGANSVLHYEAGESKGIAAVIRDAAFTPVAAHQSADYYVEARIKPLNNKTNNKFACLLGRYQDVNNWYGACLNVQNGGGSKVEFHKANGGKWFRAKQFAPRTILVDTWYKLRMEMKGDTLSFYIDDDLVGTTTDSSVKAAGKIGMWVDNRSFMVDQIAVGDANVKPVLLSVSPAATWASEVGGADREIAVAASRSDGSPDDYSVTSSDAHVVTVSKTGTRTVLHAVSAGSAKITFISGTNPALSRTVTADIEPAFALSTASYGTLKTRTEPAAGNREAYADGLLRLRFDAPISLTGKGSVRIFRASDNAPVDVIKPKGERDAIGPSADGFYRNVAEPMIRADGSTLVVHPHSGKLQYATRYYVAVADGTLKNAKLGGKVFSGLGRKSGWEFTTRAAPKAGRSTLTVDDDGKLADFRSVQGSLNYAMQKLEKDAPVTIKVRNGTYNELLYLRAKNNVTIQGESRDKTVIQFDNYDTLNSGSGAGSVKPGATSDGGRAVFLAEQADLLTLRNLTMANPHLKVNGVNNQAEVIYFNGTTQRLVAKDADFISRQDTLQLNGYSWFYNTLIAGDVDFIWGSAKAALFENSEIRTVVDSTDATKGGYLVQARVLGAADKGYVFLNSRVTREAGVPDGSAMLARSAGVPIYFDNVSYIGCKIDKHIDATGWWTNPIPNPGEATATSGWREYGSVTPDGSALNLAGRVKAAHTLTAEETTPYLSRDRIFADIHWAPQP